MTLRARTFLFVSLLALGGCVPFWREWYGHPSSKQPYSVLQPHETWCYTTMGDADCYEGPQANLPVQTLISVDPPSRFPLTEEEYKKDIMDYQKASLKTQQAAP